MVSIFYSTKNARGTITVTQSLILYIFEILGSNNLYFLAYYMRKDVHWCHSGLAVTSL